MQLHIQMLYLQVILYLSFSISSNSPYIHICRKGSYEVERVICLRAAHLDITYLDNIMSYIASKKRDEGRSRINCLHKKQEILKETMRSRTWQRRPDLVPRPMKLPRNVPECRHVREKTQVPGTAPVGLSRVSGFEMTFGRSSIVPTVLAQWAVE